MLTLVQGDEQKQYGGHRDLNILAPFAHIFGAKKRIFTIFVPAKYEKWLLTKYL